MAIGSFVAAKRICERGGWLVTNLALQKILYIIHMVYMGRTGGRLVSAPFEAWDYGPVEPYLYRKVRIFGDRAIQDLFPEMHDISGTPEADTIDEGCRFLIGKKPSELVAMTHWENGERAKNYVPGARGIRIPDEDIILEYKERTRDQD
jgi:uncharacterized phage-associated protein